jgi:hypothetical protein
MTGQECRWGLVLPDDLGRGMTEDLGPQWSKRVAGRRGLKSGVILTPDF